MKPFDADGVFCSASEADGLRRRAVRGAAVTMFSSGFGVAVQLLATLVLARLLTPADFGLVAMATAFSLLLQNVGFNGFTEAVLQRPEMTHALASNLFWVNTALSLVLAVGFAASGPVLARFYGDPRLIDLSAALALTIGFTGLSVQHVALLMRAMRFSEIALNDIVARAIAVTTSIVLALGGWGYWALAAGTIALPLATAAGAWVLCRWTPGLPRRGVGTAAAVRFAMNTYAQFAMNYLTRNLDNFLVGWRFGSHSLGVYKKAYDLFGLPFTLLSALTGVSVSTLSRLAGDPPRYERYLLGAMSTLAFVGMGLGADLTLVGKDVVFLLLGPGWDDAGRIFTLFAPGIGIVLIYGMHGWIHLSAGRPDRWFRWTFVEFAVTASLFLVGLRWGPPGIAFAWIVAVWVLTFPGVWYAGRPLGLRLGRIVGAVWRYAVAAALAGGAVALVVGRIPALMEAPGASGAVGRIVGVSAAFTAAYVGAVILVHGGCEPVRHLVGLLRDMVPWRSRSRSPAEARP